MFDHAYDVSFSLRSDHPTGEDVTPAMLKAALLKRIDDLDAANEWEEAVGAPYDSYEVEQ